MTQSELNSEIEKIVTTLQDRSKNTITGALIGELIPKITPELDVRKVMNTPTGSVLSQFIERHLSHVLTRLERQGSDWVYSITPPKQVESDPNLWRTFVSPHSSRILVIRDSTLALDAPTELDGKLKTVGSATDSELDQIRTNFTNTLKEDSESMPEIQAPYAEWSAALKKMGRNKYRDWTEYRLRSLEELFKERLNALEIASELNTELCSVMRRSRLATKTVFTAKKTKTNQNQIPNTSINSQSMESEVNLRLAIIEVIQNLSISNLREIKLPSGAIFDAIISQINKK